MTKLNSILTAVELGEAQASLEAGLDRRIAIRVCSSVVVAVEQSTSR
jgi:hypothetical protein